MSVAIHLGTCECASCGARYVVSVAPLDQWGGRSERSEAVALAEGRSVMSEWNRLNLYLIMRYFLGDFADGHIPPQLKMIEGNPYKLWPCLVNQNYRYELHSFIAGGS